MPLDPNIVSNAFANISMPDVNALMQRRVRGAENIYQIETGRQEQAAQAEQEAAKAQEAATFKALLPAYTYGIQTGDLVGAGDLVPPELRPQIQQYIDALEGRSPQEVQAALIGSLSSSPMGQEALSAIQRGQTFGVQDRQQKLAELKYEQELAAAGQPKPMSAYEEAQRGFREREIALKEQEAAAKATMPEGMDVKTKAKLDQAYPQAVRTTQNTLTNFDQDIADLDALIKDPGLKSISGIYGANTPNVSAEARRAKALFDKIKSGAGLSALLAIKAASPMGGALGNVSNQEGEKLEKSVAAFAQNQDYADLKRALYTYLVDVKIAKQNVLDAFDEAYSYRGETSAADMAAQAQARRSQVTKETLPQNLPPAPNGVTVIRKN